MHIVDRTFYQVMVDVYANDDLGCELRGNL